LNLKQVEIVYIGNLYAWDGWFEYTQKTRADNIGIRKSRLDNNCSKKSGANFFFSLIVL